MESTFTLVYLYMMELLCHIFPLTSPWLHDSKAEINKKKENVSEIHVIQLVNHPHHLAIVGDDCVDMTSLLFQGAVSCATKDHMVVYICPSPLTKIPVIVHGMPKPEANVLQHVQFQYMENVQELIRYCASIHTRSVMPDILIVDKIDHYIKQEKNGEHGLAKLCALLLDTAVYIRSKSDKGLCQVLISCRNTPDIQTSTFEKFDMSVAKVEGTQVSSQYKLSSKIKSVETSIWYRVTEEGMFLQNIELTQRQMLNCNT